MKKKSSKLSYLKDALWERARDDKNPEYRKDYRHLHRIATESEKEVKDMIEDVEMWSIRNPAFPDDYVGYPDDDVQLFDEIEEENKKKKDDKDKD